MVEGVFFGGPKDGEFYVANVGVGQFVEGATLIRDGEAFRQVTHRWVVEPNPADDGPLYRFRYLGASRSEAT